MDDVAGRETFWSLIADRAAATPDDPFAVDELGRRLTFLEYRRACEWLAAWLAGAGIDERSTVAWMLPTWVESLVVTGALARLGACQCPLLPTYRERELRAIGGRVAFDLVVIPPSWRGTDYEALLAGAMPDVKQLVVSRDEPLPAGDPATLPAPPAPSERTVWLFHTSGTTSEPKGVRHGHRGVVGSTRSMSNRMEVTADDTACLVFPVTHIGGINWLMAAMLTGCRLVLVESFAAAGTLELLRDEGVTLAGVSTAFHLAYLEAQRRDPSRRLFPRLRACPGGAAPKPAGLQQAVVDELGGVGVVSGFGLTEFPMIAMASVRDPSEKLGRSEGRASDNVEIRVITADDRVAGPCEVGEVRARGEHLFHGYVDTTLDADAFDRDGFFRTGDLGYLDEDGYLVITGRLKDVIVRKGENISAKEIEDLVYEHPAVIDVAVIGLPDSERGERACAVVVPAPGVEPPSLVSITAFLRDRGLMVQKLPEQLEVVDALPRNAAGKVVKDALKAQFGA